MTVLRSAGILEHVSDSHRTSPTAAAGVEATYAPGVADPREHAALVALLRRRPGKMTWPEIAAEVMVRGSATALWEDLRPSSLLHDFNDDGLHQAAENVRRWQEADFAFTTLLDSDYPARLRGIHQAPPILFARGALRADDVAVSVVGSRAASDRGLQIARSVARGLVARGVTVAAGLALGIDTAAHRAAVDAGGRTVAVIGTGINRTYPAANAALHREIAAGGLLLSQFWPDAPPQKHTFLMRNATMSGYGVATVVVEAGEQSGARAQARMAVEHGRPVVLIDLVVSRNTWAQQMLGRPGVHVAEGLQDVLSIVDGLTEEHGRVARHLHDLLSV